MANTRRDHEDFPTIEEAIAHLTANGFEKRSAVSEHYKHPDQMDDGYWQRADVWTLPNLGNPFARVGYWPSFI